MAIDNYKPLWDLDRNSLTDYLDAARSVSSEMSPQQMAELYRVREQQSLDRRGDLLDRIRQRALSEQGLSDEEARGFQTLKEKELARLARLAEMLQDAAQARQARATPAPSGEDFRPSIANAERLGLAEKPAPAEASPGAWVEETPPSEDWLKWKAAKDAADKATGERSLLGAAKQYYLSQTEPDKYGGISEGDATKAGLGMAAGIPLMPFFSSASPVVAAAQGASSVLPDYLLGTSTKGDVAAAAALEGGIAHGVNKVLAKLAPKGGLAQASRRPQQLQLGMDMPIPPQRAPAGQPKWQWLQELQTAKDAGGGIDRIGRLNRMGREMEGWGDTADIPRDVVLNIIRNSYNRPFARKSAPSGLEQMRQVEMMFPERFRKAKPQHMMLDPYGKLHSDYPVEFSSGGSV